ncbi:MAG: serine/threonine protein kinase [Verrucomicrobiales bacterium]|nr:serine/threonine protein kinase [Verrucomicrobiales bacterium]
MTTPPEPARHDSPSKDDNGVFGENRDESPGDPSEQATTLRAEWRQSPPGVDPSSTPAVQSAARIPPENSETMIPARPVPEPGSSIGSERDGERIGRYKLLQKIGEGGFGTVWMAEQTEPVTRRVALKIIKLGMDTREVIARFEQERQALAMMDHPNIAKVLDAGSTEKGRPFFVMELVKGIPITQYCDESCLGTHERLALFGDICSAIQHAHQKGIIHRDIKPNNVMVTLHGDTPVVKVIDFGIAKATQGKLTDKTLFTQFEQFIGTPVYMSPEQSNLSGLDIDTRSDIYSLGILLYELLTGKPPFDAKSLLSAGYEEMRRIIREVEPPKPSSRLSTVAGEERLTVAKARRIEPEKLSRLVEPDLDWIVMKAIDKDRTRRYETAGAFAQDIAHYLADEPVSATPPSAGYLFRKFARRNKAALRVAATIALVLVVATAVSTWLAVRAIRAEQKTSETLAQVAAERDEKEKALRLAKNMIVITGAFFENPDPARDGRSLTVAEVLDTVTRKLKNSYLDDPESRRRIQELVAKNYRSLRLFGDSIPLQDEIVKNLKANLGLKSAETLAAMSQLSSDYYAVGRRDEAVRIREEVVSTRKGAFGSDDHDTQREMLNLAQFYIESKRLEEAIALREEVFDARLRKLGLNDPNTLYVINILGVAYFAAGRFEEALQAFEMIQAPYRDVHGPEDPSTLVAIANLAASYENAGRFEEALKLREEVVTARKKVLGPTHTDTLKAMEVLAKSYRAIGATAMAEEVERQKLNARSDQQAPSPALTPDHQTAPAGTAPVPPARP